MTAWMIAGEADPLDGEPLCWSNTDGWVSVETADGAGNADGQYPAAASAARARRTLTLEGPATRRPLVDIGAIGTTGRDYSPAAIDTLARIIADALTAAGNADHRPIPNGWPVVTCALCGRAVRGGGPSYPDPLPYVHA